VIFEANSKEIKDTYGEFFLAELIKKCQDENNKALVSQYRDKVLGFIAISNEIDLSVLYKCFELEQFDYLLKPRFVELMKTRKQEIDEYNTVQKDVEKQKFEQKIENEKVISHRIANMNRFQT
jgi:response regulator of citrate/malate metabolism